MFETLIVNYKKVITHVIIHEVLFLVYGWNSFIIVHFFSEKAHNRAFGNFNDITLNKYNACRRQLLTFGRSSTNITLDGTCTVILMKLVSTICVHKFSHVIIKLFWNAHPNWKLVHTCHVFVRFILAFMCAHNILLPSICILTIYGKYAVVNMILLKCILIVLKRYNWL
jgi:hypothetical protein